MRLAGHNPAEGNATAPDSGADSATDPNAAGSVRETHDRRRHEAGKLLLRVMETYENR